MTRMPEGVKPYDETRSKGEQVEAMFDNIAPAYDFMNRAMSFGMHRRWLDKALEAAAFETPSGREAEIVDLATGTGDVALNLAKRFPEARITGVDLSEGMLAIAGKKLEGAEPGVKERIRFMQGDCLNLDFPDATFDFLTIAYGIRNFENLAKGFREFHRVMRQGGKCMILELSRPEGRLARLGYDLYTRSLIPLVGRLVSKDRRAYSYLPESIAAMPARRDVARMLEEAGFRNVSFHSLSLGAVTYYIAEK